MLRDIDSFSERRTIHIAGREYSVKLSQDALLYTETFVGPLEEVFEAQTWSRADIIQLCMALFCSLPSNRIAVRQRRWDKLRPSAAELDELIEERDLPLLSAEILRTALASLPASVSDEEADKDKAVNVMTEGHMRALYVDVLRRPEAEFWQSTKKEIIDRIDCYLEVKGLKQTPVKVKRYADE